MTYPAIFSDRYRICILFWLAPIYVIRRMIPQRGNRFEALRGMRQHVCGGQQPGEILPRLRGKDTPQTESPKREKQAFTDKNNYIASTANEYPFARNARASHRERGHFACWDSPKPLYDRERT